MANEELTARISEFRVKKSSLNAEAEALAVELAGAIVTRLYELFDELDEKPTFETWLANQFNTDPYVSWDIFTKDPELLALLQGVDSSQPRRSDVASLVNKQLLEYPSWLGVNKSFVEVAVIGARPSRSELAARRN